MRLVKSLSAIAGLLVSATATAVTWDTGSPPSISPTSSSIWCNQSGTCNTTGTGLGGGLTGAVIKMTAYSTATVATGGGNPTDTGTWVAAQIAMYSGGIGITNTRQTSGIETGDPQHGIDNRGVNDILVVDFNPYNLVGQDYWDVSKFSLGWTCALAASTNDTNLVGAAGSASICPSSGGAVDADAWLGGEGIVSFTSASFVSNNVSVAGETFKKLALTPEGTSGVGDRNNSSTTSTDVGRYLVIAPSLSRYSDAFKVKAISADLTSPPGGGGGSSVPVPGSVPLTAVALLSLFWVSRRRAAPVRR